MLDVDGDGRRVLRDTMSMIEKSNQRSASAPVPPSNPASTSRPGHDQKQVRGLLQMHAERERAGVSATNDTSRPGPGGGARRSGRERHEVAGQPA